MKNVEYIIFNIIKKKIKGPKVTLGNACRLKKQHEAIKNT